MVDNFELYKEYIRKGFEESVLEKNDTYYVVELIRRGKDNPDTPAANYHFKNYYIRKPEDLDKYKNEIIKICEVLNLRTYASVNYKSFKQVTLNTIAEMAHRISYNDYNKSYAVFESCSGSYCNSKNKRWIIDVDDEAINSEYMETLQNIISQCSPCGDKVIAKFPTKSGLHLITNPFDIMKFNDLCYRIIKPEIKKNHLTLLFLHFLYLFL